VVIVDDVITAGTAIREAVAMVRAAGGTVAGVVIALDRQEVAGGAAPLAEGTARESAVMSVEREVGCPVLAVLSLKHLDAHLAESAGGGRGGSGVDLAAAVKAYRTAYGV
jgi:orotate phosphoribosyltransferase